MNGYGQARRMREIYQALEGLSEEAALDLLYDCSCVIDDLGRVPDGSDEGWAGK